MKLIGMLDSPYVRRVAVSLQMMGLPFEHQNLSVFRTFDQFAAINPVVKAPTLVCDDGVVLMDSTLIIDYAETLVPPGRRLMPAEPHERQRALRLIGLALAACEKAVQIFYESSLRPPEKQHAPWVDRVTGQMRAACGLLEQELARQPFPPAASGMDQAGATAAVVWHFIQQVLPGTVPEAQYPCLSAWSKQAEQTPAFRAAPHGDGLALTSS